MIDILLLCLFVFLTIFKLFSKIIIKRNVKRSLDLITIRYIIVHTVTNFHVINVQLMAFADNAMYIVYTRIKQYNEQLSWTTQKFMYASTRHYNALYIINTNRTRC